MENEVKLTKLAKCAGCGAKVGAGTLARLLEGIQVRQDPNLLVGFDRSDDASVYKISDTLALVQTVDFFPPIADDPYLFGQIAAANALSDVYAMGGEPKLCLNIMAVPGPGSGVGEHPVRMDKARDGKAVLGLVVQDAVPPCNQGPGLIHLVIASPEQVVDRLGEAMTRCMRPEL